MVKYNCHINWKKQITKW